MLPCILSVIDHRWCQNVVRHEAIAECYHILTSSVIFYWTDARQHGIYLFYIIMKQIATHKAFVYFKILQHKAKAGLCPQSEAVSLVTLCSKELWLVKKKMPLSNLTQALLLVEWKLTTKAELNCEIYKSWKKCWKNQVTFFFIGAALWAKKLWRCLENFRSLKSTLWQKTCGCSQPRGHSIQGLHELKGA